MRNVLLALILLPVTAAAQMAGAPPRALPASATAQLVQSLDAARQHTSHVWRDTPAMNEDGTVNGYVEIPRGELRKWEFDMKANARAIDRVMPRDWRLSGELRLRAADDVVRRRPVRRPRAWPGASRRRTRARRHRRRDVHGGRERAGLKSRDVADRRRRPAALLALAGGSQDESASISRDTSSTSPASSQRCPAGDRRPTAWRMCRPRTRSFASAPRSSGDASHGSRRTSRTLTYLRDDIRSRSSIYLLFIQD